MNDRGLVSSFIDNVVEGLGDCIHKNMVKTAQKELSEKIAELESIETEFDQTPFWRIFHLIKLDYKMQQVRYRIVELSVWLNKWGK